MSMFSFDSLTLKYFAKENESFISGAIVQKIQLPSRTELILTIRNLKLAKNKKLYININPKYPHICFIDDKTTDLRNIEIPQKPPMFCMQLRKYLSGSQIKDFKCVEYERILELYFDYFDEIGSLTRICLSVEFMGKYSNIILYNAQNKVILGVAHNISSDKSSVRELYGGIKYIYPPLKEKLDILNVSYATFCQFKTIDEISDNFYYLNKALLEKIERDNKLNFEFLQELVCLNNSEYIADFWGGDSINNAIDNYFSRNIFEELMKNKKAKLKKLLSNDIKKIKTNLKYPPDDKKMLKIKQDADNLMSEGNIKESQKLYNQYKKAKTELEYQLERYNQSKEKSNYFEDVLFSIESAESFEELAEIELELGIQKEKQNKPPKITKIEYKGFEIYIGKNNKQNDYLISKIANGEDLWFHGLNYPSSHIILKVPNNKKAPNNDIIEFCAKLTKEHSKARDGGKASIIMTKRKNLKKPPNTYLGYVTYKNEVEIVV